MRLIVLSFVESGRGLGAFWISKPTTGTLRFRNQKRKGVPPMSRRTPPLPGRAVRGSTTGRPVMAAMDLLGRRWMLRILWELRDGPVGPRLLLARCEGLSSSVLYERLRELTTAGLVRKDAVGAYELSRLGASLRDALEPLDRWARSWSRAQGKRAGD
jgi:DNA-binding HxlR family transcriptional regulator